MATIEMNASTWTTIEVNQNQVNHLFLLLQTRRLHLQSSQKKKSTQNWNNNQKSEEQKNDEWRGAA